MPDFMAFAILALSAYRLTRLVTTDVITEPLRRRVWARWPDEDTVFPNDGTVRIHTDMPAYGTTQRGIEVVWSEPDNGWVAVEPSPVGYFVSCPWCVSVYCSGLIWAAWELMPTIALPVLAILALSAVTGLISQATD